MSLIIGLMAPDAAASHEEGTGLIFPHSAPNGKTFAARKISEQK